MKIGILTLHRPCNFGANLQAYTTCRYLKSLGHEVKVIDFIRPRDTKYREKVPKLQYEAHHQFIESHLPLTRQAFEGDTLCEIVTEERFDAILIGSDAVWRSPQDDCIFFAKWLFEDERIKEIPVYSLSAAHMGNGFNDISREGRDDIRNCLSKFRGITVRDKWTHYVISRDICGDSDISITINPDPVFMLPQFLDDEVWESRGLKEKGFILMTLKKKWLNSRKTRLFRCLWFSRFKRMAHRKGFMLVELPMPEGRSGLRFDTSIDFPIDPIQWFLMFKHARAFVGLRFHSIVSCIACGTPFYSIDMYGDKTDRRKRMDILGLHKKARALDYKSKIRNLLIDSPFETYRTGNIEWESPRSVLNKVMNTPPESIEIFRDEMQKKFNYNMKKMFTKTEVINSQIPEQ